MLKQEEIMEDIIKKYDEDRELYRMDNKKDIDTHRKIVALYKSSPKIREHIKKFLKTKRGVRPIVIQKRYPKIENPLVWYPRNSNMMLNISSLNMDVLTTNYGQLHFFECIFDNAILDENLINKEILDEIEINKELYDNRGITPIRSIVYNKYIIGISPIFDIDSPKDSVTGKKVYCIEIWDRLMFVKQMIEKWLDSLGIKYDIIFSGNGIYIKVQNLYFKNYEEYMVLLEWFDYITNYINHYMDQYYKYKGVYPKIDNKRKTWWNYYKTILTYHTKWNMMTGYLPKGYVDKEYVMRVFNIDNFIVNHDIYGKEMFEKASRIW